MGASAIVAAGACGGNVVVDREGAGAGGSTTTTSASTTGTTSTGPYKCDPDVPPDDLLVTDCPFSPTNGACPDKSAPEVLAAFAAKIDHMNPVGGFCCEPGCAGEQVASVACGPDPNSGGCCYTVIVTELTACMGRPFVVEGAPRLAARAPRSDWRAAASISLPDTSTLDADTRAALAAGYGEDALLEHASIASFARFTLDLLAVGAPADLVTLAQKAMGDEITHAELCFGLATAYGGAPLGPAPLPIDGALADRAPISIAVAVAREACVGETLAALAAAAARDAAEDPAARAALDRIAADEADHAALAWRYLTWAHAGGDAAMRQAIGRALREAAADAARLPEPSDTHPGADANVLRAHGRLSASERHAVLRRGLAEVVLPCTAALRDLV